MNKIETFRLMLTEPIQEEVSSLAALWKNEIVRFFLGGIVPEKEIIGKIQNLLTHWRQHSFGLWVVREKSAQQIIGLCGSHYSDDGIEVSYMFFPEFWGKGLATEAVIACIDDSFYRIKMDNLISITQKANLRSISLLKKVGFNHIKDFERYGALQSLYKITRR